MLIAIAIFLLITPIFTFSRKEKALESDNINVSKMESTHISWPYYMGGLALVAGLVLLLVDNRQKGKRESGVFDNRLNR